MIYLQYLELYCGYGSAGLFIYLFIYGRASSQDQVSENDIPDCNEQHRLVTDVSANQSAWSE